MTRQEVLLLTCLYLRDPSPGLSWWHLTYFRPFPSMLLCHGDTWSWGHAVPQCRMNLALSSNIHTVLPTFTELGHHPLCLGHLAYT